jgi:hypothetical protein
VQKTEMAVSAKKSKIPTNLRLRIIMQARHLDSKLLTHRLKDPQVLQAVVDGTQQLTLQFSDNTVLIVEACSKGIFTRVESTSPSAAQDGSPRPTKRQLEYLAFISKAPSKPHCANGVKTTSFSPA